MNLDRKGGRKITSKYNRIANKISKQPNHFKTTVKALNNVIKEKDFYTANHQQKVMKLSTKIAKKLKLPETKVTGIKLAASIHDIGKISIPMSILMKPGKLTQEEFSIIKKHPTTGHNIIPKVKFPWPLDKLIYQHHERIDGSGYPQGLKGDEILLGAKIIAVADVVEAMTAHRPYRPALDIKEALAELKENKGKLYEPKIVEACLEIFNKREG